jgi:hypothetical protein
LPSLDVILLRLMRFRCVQSRILYLHAPWFHLQHDCQHMQSNGRCIRGSHFYRAVIARGPSAIPAFRAHMSASNQTPELGRGSLCNFFSNCTEIILGSASFGRRGGVAPFYNKPSRPFPPRLVAEQEVWLHRGYGWIGKGFWFQLQTNAGRY